jgi:hypothetical protein
MPPLLRPYLSHLTARNTYSSLTTHRLLEKLHWRCDVTGECDSFNRISLSAKSELTHERVAALHIND